MMREYQFLVGEENDNERIDKCITSLTDMTLTRSYLQKMIREGRVFLNSEPVKVSEKVHTDDQIILSLPPSVIPDILPEQIPIDVLYEDEDLIVVNKPKGMVVHPAPGHYEHTLVNALLYYCKDSLSGINGVLRPGIVHRIDMDTTGSVIACKNDYAHLCIAEQLKEHSIVRKYRAICYGEIKEDEGTIDAPISRMSQDRKKMGVNQEKGKRAVTHFRVLERLRGYTYIECRLETGRTHQIRVHMAYIGHPLLGDTVYCNRKCPYQLTGQTLHAYILGFIQPHTKQYIETIAPIPSYFEDLLKKLKD